MLLYNNKSKQDPKITLWYIWYLWYFYRHGTMSKYSKLPLLLLEKPLTVIDVLDNYLRLG